MTTAQPIIGSLPVTPFIRGARMTPAMSRRSAPEQNRIRLNALAEHIIPACFAPDLLPNGAPFVYPAGDGSGYTIEYCEAKVWMTKWARAYITDEQIALSVAAWLDSASNRRVLLTVDAEDATIATGHLMPQGAQVQLIDGIFAGAIRTLTIDTDTFDGPIGALEDEITGTLLPEILIPDAIDTNGTNAGDGTSKEYNYSSPLNVIDLAFSHFERTGDPVVYEDNKVAMLLAFNSIPLGGNGLPYVNPAQANDASARAIGGWVDAIFMTGSSLYASLLYYEALRQLGLMAVAAGDTDIYTPLRAGVASALVSAHYDAGAGMFRETTEGDANTHWIQMNALAVLNGIGSQAVRNTVAHKIKDKLYGGSDSGAGGAEQVDGLGFVRYLPRNESWNEVRDGEVVLEDNYENRDYWSFGNGWIARAVETVAPGEGAKLITRWLDYTEDDPLRSYELMYQTGEPYGATQFLAPLTNMLGYWSNRV